MAKKANTANFVEFYLLWGLVNGWQIPDFHLTVCEWLEDFGHLGLLMLPRGHAKSTILDVYNAYRLYKNADELILHQGATDPDAYKCSRGTQQVLEKHPLTWNKQKCKGETQKWWIQGSSDVKHGSLHARGILSNVTGARSTFIQNDDVETPTTTATPGSREKLRYRLSEQVHILVPSSQRLFIGTPHSFDSLYTQVQEAGANCLVLRMFQHEARFTAGELEISTTFKPEYLFSGIGTQAKLLNEFDDYRIEKREHGYLIKLTTKHSLLDVYADALWADRFTSEVMEQRRKECNTVNEWDSQYQLHAKPIGEIRLDPDRLIPYSEEVTWHQANGHTTMMLGEKRIISATLKLDPSSGKTKSDISAVALVLQDENGKLYWHRSVALTGEIAVTENKGQIIGGQAYQLADIVEEFKLPFIIVETNGIGGHVPSILRSVFKKRNIYCGVRELHETQNKNKRILGTLEAPLLSGYLYAHQSILKLHGQDSPQVKEMRLFDPSVTNNRDDYVDSLAGAIAAEPIRIGTHNHYPTYKHNNNWQASNQYTEMKLDF